MREPCGDRRGFGPAGAGSVLFTVAPRRTLSTGDSVDNQARIIFDENYPIDTPVWSNTIDEDPPSSAMLPLPATQPSESFEIQWLGTDAQAGVRYYYIIAIA
jgi:hypothetical protein